MKQWTNYRRRKEILISLETPTDIVELPKKEFKPSFPNLPLLLTYRGVLPEAYWSHWEKKSYD